MTGAALLAVPKDTSVSTARAIVQDPAARVLRWQGPEQVAFAVLVLADAPLDPGGPHIGYGSVAAAGEEPGRGTVFVVANNVLAGRDEDFDRWYDTVHLPHTFEHFGFVGARRYVALDPLARHQRLVAYASPADVAAVEQAMAWASEDRALAAAEDRPPALPVSEAVVQPRHAGFYLPAPDDSPLRG